MTASPDPRHFAATRACGLLDTLDFQLRRALKKPEESQVHDLRVAIRRFSQSLDVFESCFGTAVAKRIRQKLKVVLKLAGEVRDGDVALKMLGELDPVPVKVMVKLEGKRAKAEVALTDAIAHWVGRGEPGRWRASLTAGKRATPEATAAIRTGVTGSVLRAAQRFFERGVKAWDSKEPGKDLHRLRIAAKELRYTFELGEEGGRGGTQAPIETSAGKTAAGKTSAGNAATAKTPAGKGGDAGQRPQSQDLHLSQLKALQTDLGDIHDLETVRDLLWKHHGAKKILDPIVSSQRKQVREFRELWKREFRGGAHRSRWMAGAARLAETLLGAQGDQARPDARLAETMLAEPLEETPHKGAASERAASATATATRGVARS